MIGGTSAIRPSRAGLVARLNQGLGQPVGFIQPFLYTAGIMSLDDMVSGSNGAYSAERDWDACSGLGSPDGSALLAAQKPPACTRSFVSRHLLSSSRQPA